MGRLPNGRVRVVAFNLAAVAVLLLAAELAIERNVRALLLKSSMPPARCGWRPLVVASTALGHGAEDRMVELARTFGPRLNPPAESSRTAPH